MKKRHSRFSKYTLEEFLYHNPERVKALCIKYSENSIDCFWVAFGPESDRYNDIGQNSYIMTKYQIIWDELMSQRVKTFRFFPDKHEPYFTVILKSFKKG